MLQETACAQTALSCWTIATFKGGNLSLRKTFASTLGFLGGGDKIKAASQGLLTVYMCMHFVAPPARHPNLACKALTLEEFIFCLIHSVQMIANAQLIMVITLQGRNL